MDVVLYLLYCLEFTKQYQNKTDFMTSFSFSGHITRRKENFH